MVKERFGAVSVEQLYLAMKITLHLFHDKGVLFSPPPGPPSRIRDVLCNKIFPKTIVKAKKNWSAVHRKE